MKVKRFRRGQPERQGWLFPPTLADWVPEDHPVHTWSALVDSLDLQPFYAAYANPKGRPPYDPAVMVKILVYGYARGLQSARQLERACYEDLGFRILTGNQQPDFWTIAAFRRRHQAALAPLVVETVKLAAAAGLVRLRDVAVDGTKVQAAASKHRAMSYERMAAEEARLEAAIQDDLQQMEATDHTEDHAHGRRGRGWTVREDWAHAEKRLATIRAAKARLEAEAAAKAATQQARGSDGSPPAADPTPAAEAGAPSATGAPPTATPATSEPAPAPAAGSAPAAPPTSAAAPEPAVRPPAKAPVNFTDPDSRLLRNRDKAFIQGYNAQAVVDVDSQIIGAADLTPQAADAPHLPALLEQLRANTGRTPRGLLADAGYYSEANLTACTRAGVEPFIPPERQPHRAWRAQPPPRGRIPKHLTVKDRMRRKLRTQAGRARYQKRQASIEPVFGYRKTVQRCRQLTVRGREQARAWWRLECAVFNLNKLVRHLGTVERVRALARA